MASNLFKRNSRLSETLRFQMLFTTMLICMATGVFLFGQNQNITYVTIGSIIAAPALLSAVLFMWLHFLHDKDALLSRVELTLNAFSRILMLFGLAATFFLILSSLDTVIPQRSSSVLGVCFVISMLLSYFLYIFSVASPHPNSQRLIHYVAAGLASCIILGVAVDGTDDWWTKHFSALGASTAESAPLFRVALIMASIAFIIIGHRIVLSLQNLAGHAKATSMKKTKVILAFFYITAISGVITALVGYDQHFVIHDTAAKILGVTVSLFIATSYWLFPRLPKSFIAYSLALVVASAISWPYVQSLALKLSYYEIISAAGAVMWLSMFVHLIENRD